MVAWVCKCLLLKSNILQFYDPLTLRLKLPIYLWQHVFLHMSLSTLYCSQLDMASVAVESTHLLTILTQVGNFSKRSDPPNHENSANTVDRFWFAKFFLEARMKLTNHAIINFVCALGTYFDLTSLKIEMDDLPELAFLNLFLCCWAESFLVVTALLKSQNDRNWIDRWSSIPEIRIIQILEFDTDADWAEPGINLQ